MSRRSIRKKRHRVERYTFKRVVAEPYDYIVMPNGERITICKEPTIPDHMLVGAR